MHKRGLRSICKRGDPKIRLKLSLQLIIVFQEHEELLLYEGMVKDMLFYYVSHVLGSKFCSSGFPTVRFLGAI